MWFMGTSPPGPSCQHNCLPPCEALHCCAVLEGHLCREVAAWCKMLCADCTHGITAARAEVEDCAAATLDTHRLLDGHGASQHDQICPTQFWVGILDRLQPRQHSVDETGIARPPPLRGKADACAIAATSIVRRAERRCTLPGQSGEQGPMIRPVGVLVGGHDSAGASGARHRVGDVRPHQRPVRLSSQRLRQWQLERLPTEQDHESGIYNANTLCLQRKHPLRASTRKWQPHGTTSWGTAETALYNTCGGLRTVAKNVIVYCACLCASNLAFRAHACLGHILHAIIGSTYLRWRDTVAQAACGWAHGSRHKLIPSKAEVSCQSLHISCVQLHPCEVRGVRQQCNVRCEHHDPGQVTSVTALAAGRLVLGSPLPMATWTHDLLPVIVEQVLEVFIVPAVGKTSRQGPGPNGYCCPSGRRVCTSTEHH